MVGGIHHRRNRPHERIFRCKPMSSHQLDFEGNPRFSCKRRIDELLESNKNAPHKRRCLLKVLQIGIVASTQTIFKKSVFLTENMGSPRETFVHKTVAIPMHQRAQIAISTKWCYSNIPPPPPQKKKNKKGCVATTYDGACKTQISIY